VTLVSEISTQMRRGVE